MRDDDALAIGAVSARLDGRGSPRFYERTNYSLPLSAGSHNTVLSRPPFYTQLAGASTATAFKALSLLSLPPLLSSPSRNESLSNRDPSSSSLSTLHTHQSFVSCISMAACGTFGMAVAEAEVALTDFETGTAWSVISPLFRMRHQAPTASTTTTRTAARMMITIAAPLKPPELADDSWPAEPPSRLAAVDGDACRGAAGKEQAGRGASAGMGAARLAPSCGACDASAPAAGTRRRGDWLR